MNKAATYFLLGCVLCMPFFAVSCYRTVKAIQYDRECSGYLKRAADANTIPTAKVELAKAVEWLGKTGRTTGYTSVIYNTPDEDVGFWYNNLNSSLQELQSAESNIEKSSQLERSNVLMKLRETLLDQGEKGQGVTSPSGISIYPNNLMIAFIYTLSLIFGLIGGIFIIGAGHEL